MKGEDVMVLLKLSLADEAWTVRSLAEETGIPRSGVHRALKRLADELPPVWPDARSRVRGLSLRPIHAAAPVAARRDPALGELLTLVDALRMGDARVRGVAARLLSTRLNQAAA
jgi:IclR helix-turn-helix domain